MFIFTDKRLYMQGLGSVTLRDRTTWNVVYWSNKFQSGSITPSADAGEIPAGLGNSLATMISSNARISVELTAADFSLFAKAAALGADVLNGAPALTCQTVTAGANGSLTLDVTQGTPVAGFGMSDTICYVQPAGAAATLEDTGKAHSINASTGAITLGDFSTTAGSAYLVWYYVQQANSQYAAITTSMGGKVYDLTAVFPVYTNVNEEARSGDIAGWFYVNIPLLKLMPGGAVSGDQANHDTTVITGQALADGEMVTPTSCEGCGLNASVLAYYMYVPCDQTEGITGLFVTGGEIEVPANSTHVINEFKLLVNGRQVTPDPAKMTYTLSSDATTAGLSVSGNVLTSGSAKDEAGEITGTYSVSGSTFTNVANLSVVSGS